MNSLERHRGTLKARLARWSGIGILVLVVFAARLRPNLLVRAVMLGDVPLARFALAIGADPNASRGSTDFKELEDVINSLLGTPVKPAGRVPVLVLAASHRHLPLVRLLLSAGADPNGHESAGYTALMAAVHYNNRESVRLLLEAGADPNARYKDNSTVLDDLPEHLDPQIVSMLKRARARW